MSINRILPFILALLTVCQAATFEGPWFPPPEFETVWAKNSKAVMMWNGKFNVFATSDIEDRNEVVKILTEKKKRSYKGTLFGLGLLGRTNWPAVVYESEGFLDDFIRHRMRLQPVKRIIRK